VGIVEDIVEDIEENEENIAFLEVGLASARIEGLAGSVLEIGKFDYVSPAPVAASYATDKEVALAST